MIDWRLGETSTRNERACLASRCVTLAGWLASELSTGRLQVACGLLRVGRLYRASALS